MFHQKCRPAGALSTRVPSSPRQAQAPLPDPPDFNGNAMMLLPGSLVFGKERGFQTLQTQTLKADDREALGKQTVRQENMKGEKKTGDHELFKRIFFLLGGNRFQDFGNGPRRTACWYVLQQVTWKAASLISSEEQTNGCA